MGRNNHCCGCRIVLPTVQLSLRLLCLLGYAQATQLLHSRLKMDDRSHSRGWPFPLVEGAFKHNPMRGHAPSDKGGEPIKLFHGHAPLGDANPKLVGRERFKNDPTNPVARACCPGDLSNEYFNVSTPTLVPFRLTRDDKVKVQKTAAAIMILPGGGFDFLAWEKEGTDIAVWLNSLGFNAFVLKYRVPERGWKANEKNEHVIPLSDAQRAMSIVRANAKQWSISPGNIGVIGFSAGAGLAVQLAWSRSRVYAKQDRNDETDYKPNFMMLIYGGSSLYSVRTGHPRPPPTFIASSEDDQCVPASTVRETAGLLRAAGARVELHVYRKGRHGYGKCTMYTESGRMEPVCAWVKEAEEFLQRHTAAVVSRPSGLRMRRFP